MSKAPKTKHRGAMYDIMRALLHNKIAIACILIISAFILISVFADVLFSYEEDVIKQDVVNGLLKPSAEHWFGTDALGRDYFARIMYATRVSLVLSFASVFCAMVISIALGGFAAYQGGLIDNIIMRLLDVYQSIPSTLMIICIVVALGNEQIYIVLALTIYLIPSSTRLVRATIMTCMQNEYLEAARAAGAGGVRIMLTHLIPNAFGPIMVRTTMSFALCILSTASLGYLGIGVRAPAPEWGRMLSEAQEYLRMYPYLLSIPGAAILISSTAFNLLGDAVQDALDPRLRGYRRPKRKLFAGRNKK